jgi:hypothetical protein
MIATLGPMLFQPYAENLAARLQVAKSSSVLELACRHRDLNARLSAVPRSRAGK